MKNVSLMAMAAALSMFAVNAASAGSSTSTAGAGSGSLAFSGAAATTNTSVNVDVNLQGKTGQNDHDKYDLDNTNHIQINDADITQKGAIFKKATMSGDITSGIDLSRANSVGDVINVGDSVQNTANVGNVSVSATTYGGNTAEHGVSISNSAIGAASSVSATISTVAGN